ncbi:hypothetical protein [Bradyrhizobium arachidis]|uniref:hypothetical protein n=1 Tax=Bradyrhizobium arachidis TaxID=858423 RepID=UPI002162DCB4|nr:hypothetical protein [Bradyrhizobium arachidis]UVO30585.1 hypothetical protein KUF59_07955 [Bradyrhizobium arachidis]
MKFILVNHRTPDGASICIGCRQSLETGYLRDMATRQHYCDYDCYRRYQEKRLGVHWFTIKWSIDRLAQEYLTHLGTVVSFAAVPFWCSIVLAKAAMRLGEPELLKRPHA